MSFQRGFHRRWVLQGREGVGAEKGCYGLGGGKRGAALPKSMEVLNVDAGQRITRRRGAGRWGGLRRYYGGGGGRETRSESGLWGWRSWGVGVKGLAIKGSPGMLVFPETAWRVGQGGHGKEGGGRPLCRPGGGKV